MPTIIINDLSELKSAIDYTLKDGLNKEINAQLNAIIKSEVDKANKRLSRMNDFQKSLFHDKGISHISRAGTARDKLRALAQANIVNNSGISTKTEYKRYVNQLHEDLSLSKKEVDYMLNHLNATQHRFINESGKNLKYGSNPQIDFLYEDVMTYDALINESIDNLDSYERDVNILLNKLGVN